jgi:hypothetical protein
VTVTVVSAIVTGTEAPSAARSYARSAPAMLNSDAATVRHHAVPPRPSRHARPCRGSRLSTDQRCHRGSTDGHVGRDRDLPASPRGASAEVTVRHRPLGSTSTTGRRHTPSWCQHGPFRSSTRLEVGRGRGGALLRVDGRTRVCSVARRYATAAGSRAVDPPAGAPAQL